ncbi:glycoside hydrolase family 92 protein [Streptacidiphilus sp. PB12-B1b]|uniref:lectin n=1 Tax=Streptacidiphilus sp. PB12-B1b TaxID=2705012 RepID=UPI0015FA279C|nr:lectin [Streptacidiphilus sp. PB12-B1b]QMU76599.1 glycoside hydrolase family 92 protein [Streptacidiphilus sp. PB12-B1b]
MARTGGRHGTLLRLLAVGAALAVGAGTSPLPAAPAAAAAVAAPAGLVDPFIGTTNAADDFPGADLPFGMVQWSPDTPSRPDGGGYDYRDSAITGFSLTHLAGPGCRAAGDVPVLPTLGAADTTAVDGFSHARESARPGSYTVALDDGITTELTATRRSGMARFTFPAGSAAGLVFKLSAGQARATGARFTVVNGSEVSGQVTSGRFCGAHNRYTVYFDMVFDRPFSGGGPLAVPAARPSAPAADVPPDAPEPVNRPVLHGRTAPAAQRTGGATGTLQDGYLSFDTTGPHPRTVQAKVGLSYVSAANAVANRVAENPGWDLDAVRDAAARAWNTELGRIRISGGTRARQIVFYTALYHALLHPNVISDSNGQYPGFDAAVHTVDRGHRAAYANFSGWDIYRSQAQLEALVDPQAAADAAQSMVDDRRQTGLFPKWSENNGESYVMVGDPADQILADYHAFGATGFDSAEALTGMVAEAETPTGNRPGLDYLERLGYLPSDGHYGCCNFYGPAATTLEYDSADFAVSALARALGDTAHATAFARRAQDWRHLFNPGSRFIQPRDASGAWTPGFSPTSGTDFVEGDSWQYTPMVPFDLHGLAGAMGGDSAMAAFLDTDLSSLTGADGHTDLRNEPSLDIPWEYDYVGAPYRTQRAVRRVQDQIWTDSPSGLAGNDDLGEMSSWYVWSALGMYPQTPGTSDLALGSPLFPSAEITLPSGGRLVVTGRGAADNAPYVHAATWNGSRWDRAYAPAEAIRNGGRLDFDLGTTADPGWASDPAAAPPSYDS